MTKQTWIGIVALLMACQFVLPAAAAAQDHRETTPATLEVTGRAAMIVKPDTAAITFTVESNARQAANAVSDNAKKTEALLEALRGIMGDTDKLQTASISLQPVYDKDERLRPSGYRVSNRVSLETRRMDDIGAFIDEAAATGAAKISNLQFSTSEEANHRTEAAVLAVAQARSDAQRLSRAADATLGRVLKMSYAPQGPPGVFYEKAALAMARTPVEIGDLTIEAQVVMVFELHP